MSRKQSSPTCPIRARWNSSLTDMRPLAIQRIRSWPLLAALWCSKCCCVFDITTPPIAGAQTNASPQPQPPAFSTIHHHRWCCFHISATQLSTRRKALKKILACNATLWETRRYPRTGKMARRHWIRPSSILIADPSQQSDKFAVAKQQECQP